MPQHYATYTDISLDAFKFNPKHTDLIAKKQEILDAVSQYYNSTPTSVLFLGFVPWVLSNKYKQVFLSDITADVKNYLDQQGTKYQYIAPDELVNYKKQFDWVVTADEYFTFANTEEEQKASVESLSELTKNLLLTTLRDFKNQDFKDREFSQPLAIRNGKDHLLFLEYHDYEFKEKNDWHSSVYQIQGEQAVSYGPFARRSMYFKQLAKFCIDAGAKNFYVHKNLMYKNLIKKNYEHVISIQY